MKTSTAFPVLDRPKPKPKPDKDPPERNFVETYAGAIVGVVFLVETINKQVESYTKSLLIIIAVPLFIGLTVKLIRKVSRYQFNKDKLPMTIDDIAVLVACLSLLAFMVSVVYIVLTIGCNGS